MLRFGTVNVLNSADPNFIKVGSVIRDNTNGREMQVTICRQDPVLNRILGSPRIVIEAKPLVEGKDDGQRAKEFEAATGIAFGFPDFYKYVLPFDDSQGNLHSFDKLA